MASAFPTTMPAACAALVMSGALWLQPSTATAASLSTKDVQIVAKAMGFLDPPSAGGTMAVIYSGTDAASKADAEAIVTLFGDGVSSKGGPIKAKAVDAAALGDGSGYVGVIVAAGPVGDSAIKAAKSHHIPCITASVASVQSGHCIMAIQSEPKVDITVNHEVAQAAGVGFASAFRMLIHEI